MIFKPSTKRNARRKPLAIAAALIVLTFIPAICAADITGHVYLEDGVTPVPNLVVQVFESKCWEDYWGETTTGVDGSYTVTGLDPGDY